MLAWLAQHPRQDPTQPVFPASQLMLLPMQEMAQVSNILKELQEDVSHVKSAQAKTLMDITAIYERLDEADGRILTNIPRM